MHFVYCIWIYKTQLPIHTPKQFTETQIIPFRIASKNKILRNIFKQGVERSMYKNIQGTHEEKFKRHKRKHISYLLTGRINIVNTSILPTAIYIFTAVSFKIPRHFLQNRKQNSTTCIKLLLLFSCQVMSESYWRHRLQHTRLPCPIPSPLEGGKF